MSDDGTVLRNKRLRRIYYCAAAMKWAMTLCAMIYVLLIANIAIAFLVPGSEPFAADESISFGGKERTIASMLLSQRVAFTLLLAVTAVLQMGMILSLRQLFKHFQSAEFFVPKTLETLFSLGVWFIAIAVFDIVSEPVATLVGTLDYPQTQRVVNLSLDGSEIFFMILGAFMLIFGWTLREAALLAEENRQII
ncbi:DUF2975 domain-containing protein [Roseibium sp. M-1]